MFDYPIESEEKGWVVYQCVAYARPFDRLRLTGVIQSC